MTTCPHSSASAGLPAGMRERVLAASWQARPAGRPEPEPAEISPAEAFRRAADALDGLLGTLADDVDWAAEAASADAPSYGVRHGPDAVAGFFTEFGSAMEVEEFTPVSIAAHDDDVLTVVRFGARSRGAGKSVAMDLHHFFRCRDGKIAYYRGTEDTAQTAQALQS